MHVCRNVNAPVCLCPYRWDVDAVHHPSAPVLASGAAGQVATRFGTFLPHIHSFDPTAFGLSVNEATVMVSAQLLFHICCCLLLSTGMQFAWGAQTA